MENLSLNITHKDLCTQLGESVATASVLARELNAIRELQSRVTEELARSEKKLAQITEELEKVKADRDKYHEDVAKLRESHKAITRNYQGCHKEMARVKSLLTKKQLEQLEKMNAEAEKADSQQGDQGKG